MPRELNLEVVKAEPIGRLEKVSIENKGSLHLAGYGWQLQLNPGESNQLLAFLIEHSHETENPGEPPAHENGNP
jgi:hypothetical protein